MPRTLSLNCLFVHARYRDASPGRTAHSEGIRNAFGADSKQPPLVGERRVDEAGFGPTLYHSKNVNDTDAALPLLIEVKNKREKLK
jgi:hypothetical protein